MSRLIVSRVSPVTSVLAIFRKSGFNSAIAWREAEARARIVDRDPEAFVAEAFDRVPERREIPDGAPLGDLENDPVAPLAQGSRMPAPRCGRQRDHLRLDVDEEDRVFAGA